jgi:hypothetical protein
MSGIQSRLDRVGTFGITVDPVDPPCYAYNLVLPSSLAPSAKPNLSKSLLVRLIPSIAISIALSQDRSTAPVSSAMASIV